MRGTSVHRTGTWVLSGAMAIIGAVLIVQSLTSGGAFLVRLVLGVLFVAGGSGRLYLQTRRSGGA